MQITENTTLGEIIDKSGLQEWEYMISPLEFFDETAVPIPEVQKILRNLTKGRLFRNLELRVIDRLFLSWRLSDMVRGMQFLADRAKQAPVFYHIWSKEDRKKIPDKSRTGLAAFPLLKGTSKFVVVCAGGGYENVCSLAEGYPVAEQLNRLGYAAFVLQYRTGKAALAPNPQEDLAQAIHFIQTHAEEFRIEPSGYGIAGFSAGGHLAASFCVKELGWGYFGVSRPQTVFLGYPVITMGEKTHSGSRDALLGKYKEQKKEMLRWSVERKVGWDYPRTFLWQCREDSCVPIENTQLLAEALKKAGVPYCYEVYRTDAHGWGVGTGTEAEGWLDRAVQFGFGKNA